jgi:hypothetical protein
MSEKNLKFVTRATKSDDDSIGANVPYMYVTAIISRWPRLLSTLEVEANVAEVAML